MVDNQALEAVVACAAANLLPGPPVWLMVLGPPAATRDLLNAVSRIPDIHEVRAIGHAGDYLDRVGGILRDVGERGLIVCRDFASEFYGGRSLLDRRGLTDIHEQIWQGSHGRYIDLAGARRIEWRGKCGFVAAAEETIERRQNFWGDLGSRWLIYRLDATAQPIGIGDAEAEEFAARFAVAFCELSLQRLVHSVAVPLAELLQRCRGIVQRDAITGDWFALPEVNPDRFGAMFTQIGLGLAIQGHPPTAPFLRKLAFDSMPRLRKILLVAALSDPGGIALAGLPRIMDCGTPVVLRTINEMETLGLVEIERRGMQKFVRVCTPVEQLVCKCWKD